MLIKNRCISYFQYPKTSYTLQLTSGLYNVWRLAHRRYYKVYNSHLLLKWYSLFKDIVLGITYLIYLVRTENIINLLQCNVSPNYVILTPFGDTQEATFWRHFYPLGFIKGFIVLGFHLRPSVFFTHFF